MAKPETSSTGPHLAQAHESVRDGDFPERSFGKAADAKAYPRELYPSLYDGEGNFTPDAEPRPVAGVTTPDGKPVTFEEG